MVEIHALTTDFPEKGVKYLLFSESLFFPLLMWKCEPCTVVNLSYSIFSINPSGKKKIIYINQLSMPNNYFKIFFDFRRCFSNKLSKLYLQEDPSWEAHRPIITPNREEPWAHNFILSETLLPTFKKKKELDTK